MEPEQDKKDSGAESFWTEIVKFAFIAILIVVPIRAYVAQPYIVSGGSMEPTFETGDYLIVDELSYRFRAPEYGDVIVFRYPGDQSKFFIKRVIGLPGDTVTIERGAVTITNERHPSGIALPEPYVTLTSIESNKFALDDGKYFVMGDNRAGSFDSRSWGPIEENLIIGRALIRILPISELSLLPGKADFPGSE